MTFFRRKQFKSRQRGFINISKSEMNFMMFLMVFGFLSLVAGALYGVWWLFTHVKITFV